MSDIEKLKLEIDKQEVIIKEKNEKIDAANAQKTQLVLAPTKEDGTLLLHIQSAINGIDEQIVKLNEEKEVAQTKKFHLEIKLAETQGDVEEKADFEEQLQRLKSKAKKREANDLVNSGSVSGSPALKRLRSFISSSDYHDVTRSLERNNAVFKFGVKKFDFLLVEPHINLSKELTGRDVSVLIGTPGSGKTTLMQYLFCQKAFDSEEVIMVNGLTVYHAINKQVGFWRMEDPTDLFDLLKNFPNVRDKILFLDVPISDKELFMKDVVKKIPSLGVQELLLVSSPSKLFMDFVFEGMEYDEKKVLLMPMWDENNLNELVKLKFNGKGIDDIDGMRERLENYGYVPRVALNTRGGFKEYNDALDNMDFDAILFALRGLEETKIQLVAASHHFFQLFPNCLEYSVGDYIPYRVPKLLLENFHRKLEQYKDRDVVRELKALIGYDSHCGTNFETGAMFVLGNGFSGKAKLLEDEKDAIDVGPFSEINLFHSLEQALTFDFSKNSKIVARASSGWPTVDGLCRSGWLQMTIGEKHDFGVGKGTKAGKDFYTFYKEMKDNDTKLVDTFIWIIPDYMDFTPEKMTGPAQKLKELKDVKQYVLRMSREDFRNYAFPK